MTDGFFLIGLGVVPEVSGEGDDDARLMNEIAVISLASTIGEPGHLKISD
jgi:hypothetical protein